MPGNELNRNMKKEGKTGKRPREVNLNLRSRLEELEETLRAIKSGEIDALVVSGHHGEQVYTLKDARQT